MKNSRKKRILAAGALLLMLGAAAGNGTYSYLSDSKGVKNEFVIGANTIEITEEFQQPDELAPGTTFNKYPKIRNTGSVPCYVRMLAEFSDSNIANMAKMNFESSKWSEKQADGYYYYSEILMPGETTEALFTTVTILQSADETKLDDFDIIVYGESVQSEGYSSGSEAWNAID